MGIFFKGAHMCGTKEELPPEVKASAVCVIEGVSHPPPAHLLWCCCHLLSSVQLFERKESSIETIYRRPPFDVIALL